MRTGTTTTGRGALLGAALSLLLLAACETGAGTSAGGGGDPMASGGGAGQTGDGEACQTHSACASGSACLAGRCAALEGHLDDADACAADAECRAGELCRAGLCVAAGDDDVLTCAANAECPANAVCYGGYCVVLAGGGAGGGGDDPATPEACNGRDDDGDGVVDEGCDPALACAADTDCPADALCVNGVCAAAAVELCNGLDDDFDGEVDEGCGDGEDADQDGFDVDHDCDDSDASVHPAAPERCGDGRDDDCDGVVDEGCGPALACAADADCPAGQVCVNGLCMPWETPCGAVDRDGDGVPDGCDADADGDGVPAGEDCDDTDPAVWACDGEICGNGLDDDGDGQVDEGCGAPLPCASHADCYPGQRCVNGLCAGGEPGDLDQDGIADALDVCPDVADPDQADTDADGVGDACDADADNDGVPAGEDCDDLDPAVWTCDGEVCGNGLDDDGDGQIDEGCGNDPLACASDADCPAGERCWNGLCAADGGDADADGDGFPAGLDCDDADPATSPAAPEVCGNDKDDDCDGQVDEGCER